MIDFHFREKVPLPHASLARARQAAPALWERLLRRVEWTLVEMPLPKLQRLGSDEVRFVYQIGWGDGVRAASSARPASTT